MNMILEWILFNYCLCKHCEVSFLEIKIPEFTSFCCRSLTPLGIELIQLAPQGRPEGTRSALRDVLASLGASYAWVQDAFSWPQNHSSTLGQDRSGRWPRGSPGRAGETGVNEQ